MGCPDRATWFFFLWSHGGITAHEARLTPWIICDKIQEMDITETEIMRIAMVVNTEFPGLFSWESIKKMEWPLFLDMVQKTNEHQRNRVNG